MQFERIGPVRHYGKVNDAPAILLKMNLSTCEQLFLQNKPRLHNYFFIENRAAVKNSLKPQLHHYRELFNENLARYFLEIESVIFPSLTEAEKRILSLYYPKLTKTLLV